LARYGIALWCGYKVLQKIIAKFDPIDFRIWTKVPRGIFLLVKTCTTSHLTKIRNSAPKHRTCLSPMVVIISR
jgi:hypothetical protein